MQGVILVTDTERQGFSLILADLSLCHQTLIKLLVDTDVISREKYNAGVDAIENESVAKVATIYMQIFSKFDKLA